MRSKNSKLRSQVHVIRVYYVFLINKQTSRQLTLHLINVDVDTILAKIYMQKTTNKQTNGWTKLSYLV